MARNRVKKYVLLEFLNEIVSEIYSANRTLEVIANFFGADAGCLWELNKQSNKRTFTVSAMLNRPDLIDIIEKKNQDRTTRYQIKYNISADRTISSKIFRDKSPIVGKLGSLPFNGEWLRKEHTSGLKKLNLVHICLIPIFDFEGLPIASISLYSKKSMHNIDREFLTEFSKFFSSLWITSHLKVENLELENSSMRHEVTGNLIPLETIFDGLKPYRRLIEKSGNEKVFAQFDDVDRKFVSIKNSLSDSRLKDRIAQNRSNARYVDLHSNLNSITQPLMSEVDRKRVTLDSIKYPRSGVKVYIHTSDFENLFRNLITNAIKYSVVGSTIRISILEVSTGLVITISNISKPLDNSEWRLVWQPRYRSQMATESLQDGDGLGMYVAKVICRTYGFRYKFYQEKLSDTNSVNVWSRVKIEIPREMVK